MVDFLSRTLRVVQVSLDRDLLGDPLSSFAATAIAIEVAELHGTESHPLCQSGGTTARCPTGYFRIANPRNCVIASLSALVEGLGLDYCKLTLTKELPYNWGPWMRFCKRCRMGPVGTFLRWCGETSGRGRDCQPLPHESARRFAASRGVDKEQSACGPSRGDAPALPCQSADRRGAARGPRRILGPQFEPTQNRRRGGRAKKEQPVSGEGGVIER